MFFVHGRKFHDFVSFSFTFSVRAKFRALTIFTEISVKNFCQMVLVFFFGTENRTGLSCTIYKIPVNFSLSLDLI